MGKHVGTNAADTLGQHIGANATQLASERSLRCLVRMRAEKLGRAVYVTTGPAAVRRRGTRAGDDRRG